MVRERIDLKQLLLWGLPGLQSELQKDLHSPDCCHSNRPLSGLSWQPCRPLQVLQQSCQSSACLGHPQVLVLEPEHQRAPEDQLPLEPWGVFTDPSTAESALEELLGTGSGGGGGGGCGLGEGGHLEALAGLLSPN